MKYIVLTILFFISGFHTAVGQNLVWSQVLSDIKNRYPDVNRISVDSLAHWMESPGDEEKNHKKPLLLDVREQDEYVVSHIEGAMHMAPDTEEFPVIGEMPKDTPIVVYCSVGYRSSALAERLLEAGFTNVSNLEGSIFAWANKGYAVYRGSEPVNAVHPYNAVWGRLLESEYRAYE